MYPYEDVSVDLGGKAENIEDCVYRPDQKQILLLSIMNKKNKIKKEKYYGPKESNFFRPYNYVKLKRKTEEISFHKVKFEFGP